MKEKFKTYMEKLTNNKKILFTTLGVVILLIIVFAVVVTAGGGKEEPGDNGTKLANDNNKEEDSSSSEESTTYPVEIQTKEDGTIVSVVTQDGQTLNLAEAQTEIDAEGNTIFTTQQGDKVILDNKGSVTHVTESKTVNQAEESTTPIQKSTDTSTQKPTDAPKPTQKPTDVPAPTQKPTDVPAPTQKPTDAPAPTEKPTEKPTEPPTYYYNGREVSELEYKIQTDKWNEKAPSGSTLSWGTNEWGFYYDIIIPEWNENGRAYECDDTYEIKETYKGTTIVDAYYEWYIIYSDNSYCILIKPTNDMNSHHREYLSSLGL